MNIRRTRVKEIPAPRELASYFGLTVEIIFRMRNCTLIRWRDREFIVETGDLLAIARHCAA
jgi:hypothetical protein